MTYSVRIAGVIAAMALYTGLSHSTAFERRWGLYEIEKSAFLLYGIPESADIGLGFLCSKRSGTILLTLPEKYIRAYPNRAVTVRVASGGRSFKLRGKIKGDQKSKTASLALKLKASDPLFHVLESNDYFTISIDGNAHNVPLTNADITGLVDLCRKNSTQHLLKELS